MLLKKIKNLFSKFSMYKKMFFSYLIIVCFIVAILGVSLYISFSNTYKKQVIEINNKIIQQKTDSLEEEYFKKIKMIYAKLASNNINSNYNEYTYFLNNSYKDNATKIYELNTLLQKEISVNLGTIDAIHLYFPKNNMILSTQYGIKYVDKIPNKDMKTVDWFEYTKTPPTSGVFLENRLLSNIFYPENMEKGISYIREFPLFYSPNNIKGTIVFDINEDKILNILCQSQTSNKDSNIIVNNNGDILFESGDLLDKQNVKDDIFKKMLNDKKLSDNYNVKINNEIYMLSYSNIPSVNWKIITIIPINHYYHNSHNILKIVLIFCFITSALGLIFIYLFSKSIYSPIKKIISNLQRDKNCNDNECLMIENAIEHLSAKIENLEINIAEYTPFIKQNFIISLFNNSISYDEYVILKQLSNISFDKQYFNCMLLTINKIFETTNIHTNYISEYAILKIIESFKSDNISLSAVILSKESVGVLVNSNDITQESLINMVDELLYNAKKNYNIGFNSSIGNWTENPTKIYECFNQATYAIKYSFWFPNEIIMCYDSIQSFNQTKHISINNFVNDLKSQKFDNVNLSLDNLINELLKQKCTLSYCNSKLNQLLEEFSKFAESHFSNTIFTLDFLSKDLDSISNINEFKTYFLSKIELLYAQIKDKNSNKNQLLIENIQNFIANNLSKDLSLDLVADYVDLNPKYVSKLFKEYTGTNFQQYVTKLKLNKAKDFCLSSDLCIDQIAREIGYNSTSYFIRQFKSTFGFTPAAYRSNFK